MTVSVQYLAEHIDDMLAALSSGETVEVAREGQGTLVLSANAPEEVRKVPHKGPRILGAGRMKMRSISWEEWQQIDREWKAGFLDEPDVD